MLQTIKKLLLNAGILSLFMVPLAIPAMVGAQGSFDTCTNVADCVNVGADSVGDSGSEPAGDRVLEVIKLVINIISFVVGIVAVIMIVIGGLKYITSNGDTGNVSSAKNTILYAIIGLVIVVFAQLIVRFVLERTTTTA